MSEQVPSWVNPGGCLPRTDVKGQNLPTFADGQIDVLDVDEWDSPESEADSMEWLVKAIQSQGRTDMCASFGTKAMHEIRQAVAFGVENVVILSASSIYNLDSVGRGRPGGSTIQSNVIAMQRIGALPAAVESNRPILKKMGIPWEHTMPLADYSARSTREMDVSRQHFRLDEVYDIDEARELWTAPRRGMPAVYGREMHAICLIWSLLKNRRPIGKYDNSWSEDWGYPGGSHSGGFGYDDLLRIDSQLRSYGGAAARSIVMTDAHQGLM